MPVCPFFFFCGMGLGIEPRASTQVLFHLFVFCFGDRVSITAWIGLELFILLSLPFK
jgi:hypothetical protein